MSNISIELLDYVYSSQGVIDWSKSVAGTLDVTSHSEFPLAITFSVSEIKDINARKGDFSKTFKIPATKNNNLLYKNLYIVNSRIANNLSNKKPCRLLINNLYSISGLLQIKSIGMTDKPSYYSCVFYGNNVGWASAVGEKLLKDLGTNGDGWDNLKGTDTGKNLKITKYEISQTWNADNALDKFFLSNNNDMPVVYPVTSYGDFNPSGIGRTIQLLNTNYGATGINSNRVGYTGFDNSGNDYGNPDPTVDWRPCLWVYDVITNIFRLSEYTLVSNFIETDMFKKLLFSLPNFKYNNPDERYNLFSTTLRFNNPNATPSTNSARVWNNGGSSSTTVPVTTTYAGNNNSELIIDEVIYPYNTLAGSGGANGGFNLTLNGGSSYNLSQDIWYAPEYGRYDVRLRNWSINIKDLSNCTTNCLSFFNDIDQHYDYIRVQIQRLTVGQTHWKDIGFAEGAVDLALSAGGKTGSGTGTGSGIDFTAKLSDFEESLYLNKGDQLRLHLKAKGYAVTGTSSLYGTITGTYKLFAQHNTNIPARNGIFDVSLQPDYTEYGQTYDLKNVINKDYKQIDFIKGVAHAFNLQFTTDESSKTVYIEPFDSFYKPFSDAIDWTQKVDLSQEIKDKLLNSDIKKDIIFKYKTDSKDEKVRQRGMDYWKEILDEYPYFETLSDDFERGTTTFENPFFAGTTNIKDLDSTNSSTNPPYIACLWQEKEEKGFISGNDYARPDKGFEFLPRLLFWKKYAPSSITLDTGKIATIQTWNSTTENIIAYLYGFTYSFSPIYPQATSVNRDDNTSPVLTYGNVWVRSFDDATNIYGSYEVGKGLYESYYKNMIEMMKYNPRVKSVNLNLKLSDIVNLDLRKLIYINGVYWRINKIQDYKPLSNSTTKVELLEFPLLGDFSPETPTVNENDGNWTNSPLSNNIYEF